MTGSVIGGDAVYYYSQLRSIVLDKDVDFANEYEYFHNQKSSFTGNRKIPHIPKENSITNKLPNIYPIGTAILLIPFFYLAHLVTIFLQILGLSLPGDGYSIIYQTIAAIGSLLYAFGGVILIYLLGKRFFEPEIAFFASVCLLLATPLIYYITMEPLTSQPISFFCVSLFIYLWYKTRLNRRFYEWIILGALAGLMSIVRYQDAFFLLIPVIDSLIITIRQGGGLKTLLSIFGFMLIAIVVALPQFKVNNFLFGSFLMTGYSEIGFPYLTSPKILYSLFSWERGLLVWSPILSFALIGLYWFVRRFKLIGGLLIISFLIQLYVVSSWSDPSQGDSFGNRILLNSSLIFALGLMQFLKNTQTYKKLFLVIFTLLILTNGILAYLFIFRIIGQPY